MVDSPVERDEYWPRICDVPRRPGNDSLGLSVTRRSADNSFPASGCIAAESRPG